MLDQLATAIDQGNLVAFLGAGVSRSWTEPATGKRWPGIPAAADMVRVLAATRPWAKPDLPYDEAMFLLREREGRAAVERFILDQMDRPNIRPLPAHTVLASLGIRAFITTNYDRLLERALEDAHYRPCAVITDEDVARIQPRDVPVIKYHGCMSRPATIVAAKDEYRPLNEVRPIVGALLTATLANKSLLFAGFGLSDPDFINAYEYVASLLGPYMPRSYAIVHQVTDFQQSYWDARKLQLIRGDLTDTLRSLSAMRQQQAIVKSIIVADWSSNPFFADLHEIRTKPSETQVADAYLSHLTELIQQGVLPIDDIIASAREAQSLVLATRPNFLAFKEICDSAIESVEKAAHEAADPGIAIRQFMHARESVSISIAALGRQIPNGSSIGLYSQSKRVQQVILGAHRAVQQTCGLIIGECRPKSPVEFQDALEICRAMRDSSYELTVVPDVALAHLLTRNQITHLLLGAHAVYMRNGSPESFVNTAGSAALCTVASQAQVPIWIIAENVKLEALLDGMRPAVSYAEEEQLFGNLQAEFAILRSEGMAISARNIGYDLVPCVSGMTVFTEDNSWTL